MCMKSESYLIWYYQVVHTLTHWVGHKMAVWISIKVWLNLFLGVQNFRELFQLMAWHRSDDNPLFEPMMVSLLTHICVTRLQWVKPFSQLSKFHDSLFMFLYTSLVYCGLLHTALGHMMSAEYHGQASRVHARIITDYMSTDGYCLELHHWTKGSTVLQVTSRSEDFMERVVVKSTKVNYFLFGYT